MHASNTLLLAALASSAAAQVDVVHVLETMHLLPRSSSNAPADVLLARQGASLEECASSLSDIVKDMPTLPTEVIEYAVTATGPAPTDVCTQALPLSLSKPILDAVTAFAYWGADHSQEAMEWMSECNEEDLAMPDADPIMNPGDMMLPNCTEEEAILLFTDSRTTQTVVVGSVISDLRDKILASISEAEAGGSATTTGVEASGTASGDAQAETTGAESSAATGAAESTGAGSDGGSGAVRVGLTGAGVAAMAGIVGLLVSL